MPKQLAEIRSFNAGTVLSTDASDIPIEAASFSLNLEVGVEQGVLQGVPEDVTVNFHSSTGTIKPWISSPISYIEISGFKYLVIKTSGGWKISANTI
tara:strand:+ start:6667 stop:6957 length:291 start_codon:yes stop_codon:yes gene_type:complete